MDNLWVQVLLTLLFSVSVAIIVLIIGNSASNKKAMTGEQIFYNTKRIEAYRKKLEKLERKRKPNKYEIDIAKRELETELLFEKCTVFGEMKYDTIQAYPNACIMFSDDNQVMRFLDVVIPYSNIKSYAMVPNNIQKAVTHTKNKGGVGRAIVGGAIAGPVGAVVGAVTSKSKSDTTYYTSQEGFILQIGTKDEHFYQCHVSGSGFFSDKIHASWNGVFYKLDDIIKDNK